VTTGFNASQVFWDSYARHDPLWAILSDPSKTGRRWDLPSFLETGRREVSLLLYQLSALGIDVRRDAALDFGCGVGRLTQPLAAYFDRVVGVDISSEMIKLASEMNSHPGRVVFVSNDREDLSRFATGEFTFAYSNLVLQHIEPDAAWRYLRELLRVIGPDGVLVFQVPSHRYPPGDERPRPRPMPEQAYRAAIRVDGELAQPLNPGTEIVVPVSVVNQSDHPWSAQHHGALRAGNHWLTASGQAMLIQDDGRAPMPEIVGPGQVCRAVLTVTAPLAPGEYQLECDLVHEGVTWFADRGSPTWRTKVSVVGSGEVGPSAETSEPPMNHALSLPDSAFAESPGPLPMHGIHRDEVERLIAQSGATLVHREEDERGGHEWVGYRYFVKRNAGSSQGTASGG
jgi:SAM-dependent methyltransferase